jgi:hypothetical protein
MAQPAMTIRSIARACAAGRPAGAGWPARGGGAACAAQRTASPSGSALAGRPGSSGRCTWRTSAYFPERDTLPAAARHRRAVRRSRGRETRRVPRCRAGRGNRGGSSLRWSGVRGRCGRAACACPPNVRREGRPGAFRRRAVCRSIVRAGESAAESIASRSSASRRHSAV